MPVRQTSVRLSIVVAAAMTLGACANMSLGRPPHAQASLPEAVKVPAGHMVAMEAVGAGDITYECRVKTGMAGQFEWVFVGPDAKLMDRNGMQIGRYFGPPATWEHMDGSKLTGAQVAVAPASNMNDIPLQLIKASPATGNGAMQGVSYIQRIATRGGIAPSTACGAATLGQKQLVKYLADYIFWRAS